MNLISTGVSQLSLSTFRGGEKIPDPLLVRQPDNARSRSSFLKRVATGLATNGNAFLLKTLYADGQVSNLEALDPNLVTVEYSDTGKKRYRLAGRDQPYAENRIVHLRLTEVPGQHLGLGPIQSYRRGMQAAIDLRDYPSNFHKNNGVPTGILSVTGENDEEQSDAMRERWHKVVGEGGVAVLGNGAQFTPLLMSPADIAFIESQNLSDLQIARVFGVDAAFLNIPVNGTSLTYANRTDLDIQFVRWSLMAYLTEIEDAISSALPRGTEVKFNVEDFLRAYQITPTERATSDDVAAA